MKGIIILVLTLCLTLPTQGGSTMQNKPSRTQKRRPAARAKQPPVDVQAEAAKVADQLKLFTRFVYLYGRISASLESMDEQARRGKIDQDLPKTEQSKASIVENIKGLRAGLERLEQNFHADPRWQQQSLKLISASDVVAKAEQFAAAGRFDEAGRVLLNVVERLVDVLVEIR